MFDDFADEILKADVTTKSNHLKNCQAVAVVTGIKRENTRSGPLGVLDLQLIKVASVDPANTNVVGEKVARTYPMYGDIDKKTYFQGLLKKDMCLLAGSPDYKKISAEDWKRIGTAAAQGAFVGMLIQLDPYEYEKGGAKRIAHNITKVGDNSATAVAKRAALLAKGAGPEAFL